MQCNAMILFRVAWNSWQEFERENLPWLYRCEGPIGEQHSSCFLFYVFKHFINNNIQVRVDFNTVLSIKHKHIITVVDSDEWRSIDEFLRDVRSNWHIQTLLLLATRCQTYAINLFTNNRRFF